MASKEAVVDWCNNDVTAHWQNRTLLLPPIEAIKKLYFSCGDLVVMASNVVGDQFIIGSTKAGMSTDSSWLCTDARTKDTNPDDWSPAVEMGPDKSDEFDKFSNCPVAQRPCAKRIWAQNDPGTGQPPTEVVCTKRQGIPSDGEQHIRKIFYFCYLQELTS